MINIKQLIQANLTVEDVISTKNLGIEYFTEVRRKLPLLFRNSKHTDLLCQNTLLHLMKYFFSHFVAEIIQVHKIDLKDPNDINGLWAAIHQELFESLDEGLKLPQLPFADMDCPPHIVMKKDYDALKNAYEYVLGYIRVDCCGCLNASGIEEEIMEEYHLNPDL